MRLFVPYVSVVGLHAMHATHVLCKVLATCLSAAMRSSLQLAVISKAGLLGTCLSAFSMTRRNSKRVSALIGLPKSALSTGCVCMPVVPYKHATHALSSRVMIHVPISFYLTEKPLQHERNANWAMNNLTHSRHATHAFHHAKLATGLLGSGLRRCTKVGSPLV